MRRRIGAGAPPHIKSLSADRLGRQNGTRSEWQPGAIFLPG